MAPLASLDKLYMKYPFLFALAASARDIEDFEEELDCPPWPSEILPSFLYLGNYGAATNIDALKTLGIKHIVNVSQEENFFLEAEDRDQEADNDKQGKEEEDDEDFRYHNISIPDKKTSDIRSHFAAAIAFIGK